MDRQGPTSESTFLAAARRRKRSLLGEIRRKSLIRVQGLFCDDCSRVELDRHVRKFVTRQPCSAFSSKRSAISSPPPTGKTNSATMRSLVKRIIRSTRSSVPSAWQRISVHSSFEARAMALKVRTKQSTTAATSKASGDHWSPGTPNSSGGAEAIGSTPLALG